MNLATTTSIKIEVDNATDFTKNGEIYSALLVAVKDELLDILAPILTEEEWENAQDNEGGILITLDDFNVTDETYPLSEYDTSELTGDVTITVSL